MTDFLNAFMVAYVQKWLVWQCQPFPSSFLNLRVPSEVTVVLLDNHVESPYDPIWSTLFGRLVRVTEFNRTVVKFKQAGENFSLWLAG